MKIHHWYIPMAFIIVLILVFHNIPVTRAETYENQYGKIEVYPDVARDGLTQFIQYCNVTPYAPLIGKSVDVAFKFPFDLNIQHCDIWIWKNVSHLTFYNESQPENTTYTWWFEWVSIKHRFGKLAANIVGVSDWELQDRTYRFKVKYNIPLNYTGVRKWSLIVKLHGEPWNTNKKIVIDPAWWDSDWQFSKLITLSSPRADTPVMLDIGYSSGGDFNLEGHCEHDGRDIRFTDITNSTELSWWMENYSDSEFFRVWVNTSLSNYSSFYVYYGNSSATYNGDGTAVFWQFDDFEDGLQGNWITSNPTPDYASSTYAFNSSQCMELKDPGSGEAAYLPLDREPDNNIFYRAYYLVNNDGMAFMPSHDSGGNRYACYYAWAENETLRYYDGSAWRYPGSQSVGVYHWFSARTDDIDDPSNTYDFWWNETKLGEDITWRNNYNPPGGNYDFQCFQNSDGNSHQVYVDNVMVGNWSSDTTSFSSASIELTSFVNNPPVNAYPSPSDGATGVSLNPRLVINVTDSDVEWMNTSFWTNASGSWWNGSTNMTLFSGWINASFTNFSSYNTKYWWSVNTTDGEDLDNDTYSFTTMLEPNNAPVLSNPVPVNESYDNALPVNLSVTCTDPNGHIMNATWSSNSSGSWLIFAENISFTNGTIYQNNSNFSSINTTYYFRLNLTDNQPSEGLDNETYWFHSVNSTGGGAVTYTMQGRPLRLDGLSIAIAILFLFFGLIFGLLIFGRRLLKK